MVAPVIESFTTAFSASNVTTLAINKPTGVTSGDLLLILCANEANDDVAQWNGTTPTGFTWLGSEYGSSVSDQTASGYYRIADGTEGSTFTVTSTGSWERTQWCFRISGVDQTTPINVEEGGLRNANTSYVIPTDGGTQLTTTVNDCLLFCLASYDGGDSTDMTVSGTGWSQHSSSPIITGTGGANMSTCIGTGTLATAGDAPVMTAAVTSVANDGWAHIMVAVAPGGAAAPTASGTPTDQRDTATGSATSTEPTATASGTPTDQRDTASGSATFSATVPDAVSDLAGTAGDAEVVLTWSAPPNGGAAITDYIVQYRPA